MFSLTIHFGPNAMVWAFLFKDKETATRCCENVLKFWDEVGGFNITDDFGQHGSFRSDSVHGVLLEDVDLVEEARIYRSLANARGEVKARQRAATDPVIRAAQNGPAVMTPNFRQ